MTQIARRQFRSQHVSAAQRVFAQFSTRTNQCQMSASVEEGEISQVIRRRQRRIFELERGRF
jgi:hypothetical protein